MSQALGDKLEKSEKVKIQSMLEKNLIKSITKESEVFSEERSFKPKTPSERCPQPWQLEDQ